MENQLQNNAVLYSKKAMIPLGELFTKCFEVYKNKALVMGALMLLSFFTYVVAGMVLVPMWLVVFFGGGRITLVLTFALVFLVLFLIILIVNILIQLSLLFAIKEQNVPLDIKTVKGLLSASWSRIGSFVWVTFLKGIIVMVGFILFIIPGIIFSIWFSLSSMVFIFENKKGYGALQGSKDLVKGYWWPVFGRFLVLGFIAMLFTLIPGIGNVISMLIVAPFCMVYMYTIYEDLKRVKA